MEFAPISFSFCRPIMSLCVFFLFSHWHGTQIGWWRTARNLIRRRTTFPGTVFGRPPPLLNYIIMLMHQREDLPLCVINYLANVVIQFIGTFVLATIYLLIWVLNSSLSSLQVAFTPPSPLIERPRLCTDFRLQNASSQSGISSVARIRFLSLAEDVNTPWSG